MTTPRIYKKIPYTPEQALAVMLKERSVHFDPILLKIFIGLVGIHPLDPWFFSIPVKSGSSINPITNPNGWIDLR